MRVGEVMTASRIKRGEGGIVPHLRERLERADTLHPEQFQARDVSRSTLGGRI